MERVERSHGLGIDWLRMEQADLLGGVDYGARSNSIHHQFLLEHQARRKSERQSVGSDDARMDGAFAPPHGNFVTTPVAYRGPYEYSLPGRERDYTMQNEPVEPA